MIYPVQRLRRLRQNQVLREMLCETRLDISEMVMPLFVDERLSRAEPIQSLSGQMRWSLNDVSAEVLSLQASGIKSIMLFGLPKSKDAAGSGAYDQNGVVQQAIKRIKDKSPDMFVMTDVCLCEYTDHGHCGLTHEERVLNDATLPILAKTAVSHAQAGADLVAPSDMMDGRVSMIRRALDESGFNDTPLMSYAVKHASAYYGPFRAAADSTPQFGDRKSYQMNSANRREAMLEAAADVDEGADILLVRPALPSLDLIRELHDSFSLPIAAYQVSGEYAQIKSAARDGLIDERAVILESLIAIRRAGAKLIVTYFAKQVANFL